VKNLDGRLTRILVFIESPARRQRNHGLTQDVFVASVDGVCTATARGAVGACELFAGHCRQRELVHLISFVASPVNS
jgi:hypothetical protein